MASIKYIDGSSQTRERAITGSGTTNDPDVFLFSSNELGAKADTAATSDTGSFSLISLFKRLLTNVGSQADTAATSDTGSFSLISLFKRLLTIVSRPTILYANATLTATSDTSIVTAPGVGNSVYITHLVVQNITATSTTVNVKAGGTTVLSFLLPSQGASQVITFPQRRDFKLAANTALILQATTANAITYSIGYFTGA